MTFLNTLRTAFLGLATNKLRSGLTTLGIIIGVASVIAMLAIGEGASYEAQEQIRKLGSQNIIIRSVKPPQNESVSQETSRMDEYGLTFTAMMGAEAIKELVASEPFAGIPDEHNHYISFLAEPARDDLEMPYQSTDGDFRILEQHPGYVVSALDRTQGRGTYSMEPFEYQPAPSNALDFSF